MSIYLSTFVRKHLFIKHNMPGYEESFVVFMRAQETFCLNLRKTHGKDLVLNLFSL